MRFRVKLRRLSIFNTQLSTGDWPARLIEKKSPAPKYKSASMANQKIDIMTHSVDETRKLGHQIGTLIKQPLVIALIGDLGSGKTAFVQGLAKGIEVPDGFYITSPTFTLVNEYPGRYPLVHMDLYRLENMSDLTDIGLDEMLHGQAVIAIEWADKLSDGLPAEHLLVRFEVIDDDCRILSLNATGHNEVNLILALEYAWSE